MTLAEQFSLSAAKSSDDFPREHVLWTFGVIWLRVTSYSVAVCSFIYLLAGFLYIRRRVREDARWITVPLIYAIWGALFSFLSAGTIAVAIGTAYIALHEAMTQVELWVYVGSLSITFMYFSTGHIPILYTI
ncbi:hypothetical protein XU18_2834 [Perkinsela sp. CCAP 1560/4]|nr:hypothetical protein XU18_2834 [Perkinsela sp. CCAP 1560/4]|eukprot:KNH06329.1 hypothetical protein XU18_2834 [Perkinsela sp. CCAP 1560/4]